MYKITYCDHCRKNQHPINKTGYNDYVDNVNICPICKNPLVDVDISVEDFRVIRKVSNDVNFIEQMINLKESNVIEYQINMSKIKDMQAVQTERTENVPKCPTCHSKDIRKIQLTQKASSVFLWGLLSQKVKRTYHCNNCGYEW